MYCCTSTPLSTTRKKQAITGYNTHLSAESTVVADDVWSGDTVHSLPAVCCHAPESVHTPEATLSAGRHAPHSVLRYVRHEEPEESRQEGTQQLTKNTTSLKVAVEQVMKGSTRVAHT